MIATIDAIYRDGAFHPTTPMDLPEGTAASVTVRALSDSGGGMFTHEELLARIREVAAKANQSGPVEFTSRDHDQILYGGPDGAL